MKRLFYRSNKFIFEKITKDLDHNKKRYEEVDLTVDNYDDGVRQNWIYTE